MSFPGIAPTRYINGVTDVSDVHPSASIPAQVFPPNSHQYWDDFDQFVPGDWTVTETQVGATQGLAAGDGGQLALVNTALAPDINSIQRLPAAFNFWPLVGNPSKKLYFEGSFHIDQAVLGEAAIGLQSVTATPFAPAHGVYFHKPAGAATVNFVVRSGGASVFSANAISTIVAGTFMALAWYFDPESYKFYYGANGVLLGSSPTIDLVGGGYLSTIMTPTISVGNGGTAAARTLRCDYIQAVKVGRDNPTL